MADAALAASVVVPSHRGAHRLPALLAALAGQDVQAPWELVVALDGVLDESEAVLAQWRDRLPLRVLAGAEPAGVVVTLNHAFGMARGEVLIRCDDDLTPRPDFVRRHLSWHEGRTDVGVVGPTRDVFPDTRYAAVYGVPANRRLLDAAYRREAGQRWISWAANNSVHRETWARVGGFDPRFVYGQDSELGWRLAAAGVEIVIDPALEVEHRGPSTTATGRVPRAYVSGASRRLFDEVHPGAHAPDAVPRGRARLYDAAVTAFAGCVRDIGGYERLGRLLDRVLPRLPDGLAGRAVAFGVESAGRSGRRHGVTDLSAYKTRKATELAAERQREGAAR